MPSARKRIHPTPAELSITGLDLARGGVIDGIAVQQQGAAVVALGAAFLGLAVTAPVLLVRRSRPRWFGPLQAVALLAGLVCGGAVFMLRESGIRLAESLSFSGSPTPWVLVPGLLAALGGMILVATPIHAGSD